MQHCHIDSVLDVSVTGRRGYWLVFVTIPGAALCVSTSYANKRDAQKRARKVVKQLRLLVWENVTKPKVGQTMAIKRKKTECLSQ